MFNLHRLSRADLSSGRQRGALCAAVLWARICSHRCANRLLAARQFQVSLLSYFALARRRALCRRRRRTPTPDAPETNCYFTFPTTYSLRGDFHGVRTGEMIVSREKRREEEVREKAAKNWIAIEIALTPTRSCRSNAEGTSGACMLDVFLWRHV